VVHPTPRSGDPGERVDPETPARLVLGEPLPLEPGAGAGAATVALSTSFGFGGANAAAVFSGAGR
jgi:3-oxoacyl-(acyl-carrier-protein) synthase